MAPQSVPATSESDLITMAALGDEEAKKQLARLSKGEAPGDLQPQEEANGGKQTPVAKAAKKTDEEPEEDEEDEGEEGEEDEGEEGEEDEGEDEEQPEGEEKGARLTPDVAKKGCGTKKSISESSLMKAIDLVEQVALGAVDDAPDRRMELSKAFADGTLDDAGRQELMRLLGAEQKPPEELEKSYQDLAVEDEAIAAHHVDADGLDVSGYLERLSMFVGGALDRINQSLVKSLDDKFGQQNRFNAGLAKALREMGTIALTQQRLIKSLNKRLEVVEETPLPRAAKPTLQALRKSDPVHGGNEWTLSRDETIRGLNLLMVKSVDGRAPSGDDITMATVNYENPLGGSDALGAGIRRDILNVLNK